MYVSRKHFYVQMATRKHIYMQIHIEPYKHR